MKLGNHRPIQPNFCDQIIAVRNACNFNSKTHLSRLQESDELSVRAVSNAPATWGPDLRNFAKTGVITSHACTTRTGQDVIHNKLALLVNRARATSDSREGTAFTAAVLL